MEKFRVVYHWHNVDWAAQYIADDFDTTAKETSATAKHMQKVAQGNTFKHVTDALDAFLHRFYPDENIEHKWQMSKRCKEQAAKALADIAKQGPVSQEAMMEALIKEDPVHQASIPWHGHDKNKDFYEQIQVQENLDWLDIDLMCSQSLEDKLAEPWLLSWHWREIIPYIRYWKENKTKQTLLIQQCQVRQWELLLCYELTKGVDFETCRHSDLNGNLVRAPIMGRSHRMRRWDVYRLLFSPKVLEEIAKAAAASTTRECANNPLALAYVLGRHDCIYHIKTIKKHDDPLGLTIEGHLRIELQPEKFSLKYYGTKDHVETGCDGKPFMNSHDLVMIPAFSANNKKSVLLASDNYCMAVEQLSEVMNDPTVKSALIIAPPGSGKERLSQMAYVCRCRIRNKLHGPFVATTLAGMDVDEAQRMLFSFEGKLPNYKSLTREADIQAGDGDRRGLVFQALGGALFLDEIDKTKEPVLAMLLRFLESQEILLPDRNIILHLKKDQVPLYVFAGSMIRRDMFDLKPADFWTRVSHVVEMPHPLAVDTSEMRRIVREYIRMFWIEHAETFLDAGGHMGNQGKFDDPDLAWDLYQPVVYPVFQLLRRFLLSNQIVEFVCDILGDELVGHGQTLPSIRRIRSIVGRSVFSAVELLLYSKEYGSAIEKLKEANKDTKRTQEEWFSALCGYISSRRLLTATPPPATGSVDIHGLKLAEQLESALRHSAVFSS